MWPEVQIIYASSILGSFELTNWFYFLTRSSIVLFSFLTKEIGREGNLWCVEPRRLWPEIDFISDSFYWEGFFQGKFSSCQKQIFIWPRDFPAKRGCIGNAYNILKILISFI